ncbi:MAG: hypothetical protein DSM107014_06385 [Gomphosphaeria aponina SAG 52.96 = DSM 107014]|uniref:Uncharacterized protein n=1 Tax=Gomphosphaeria aponina SAG 52.96 = DSM 107014 TaxID=1521640 RepID=A0A941GQ75_9CHRO|nr:hypothetical protein [Gomphosphaeria aponina SAG 52.96 = DSM 107014]
MTNLTQHPTKQLKTENSSINRKVAFASGASAVGALLSIFVYSLLLSVPWVADNLNEQHKAELKTALSSLITATVTLIVGYQVRPGLGDGVIEEEGE